MNRNLNAWRGTGLRPFDDFYKEMDHLVRHFLGPESANPNGLDFVPHANVAETNAEYEVTLDVPGIKADDLSVEVHDNQLTVSGKRHEEEKTEGKTFHRIERRSGEFRRTVALPAAIDEHKIVASYRDGVLTITLPKSDKLKPTRIAVNATAN